MKWTKDSKRSNHFKSENRWERFYNKIGRIDAIQLVNVQMDQDINAAYITFQNLQGLLHSTVDTQGCLHKQAFSV